MTNRTAQAARKRIEPVYPFGPLGESILLYDGPLGGIAEDNVPGVVELRLVPEVRVVWRVEYDQFPPGDVLSGLDADHAELRLWVPEGEHVVNAHRGDWIINDQGARIQGWLDTVSLGSTTAAVDRIVVHWLNLPSLLRTHWIEADGARWTGGWRAEINGWRLTLDRRRDHKDVWPTLRDEQSIGMTHVMEIRRGDGQSFTVIESEPIFNALHFGLSFALGRWVAPALPVAFDAAGHRVWERWAPWFCDPGGNGGLAWWDDVRADDLQGYLAKIFDAFHDDSRAENLRVLMAMAVGVNRGGFIEQRIITAMSAMEHLSWIRLKLEAGISRQVYEDLGNAGERLRVLLEMAGIPTDVDAEHHSALSQFADDGAGPGEVLDGPASVVRIRNRIVHPDDRRDDIYRRRGLLTEAWFLARHYLVLLLLHWIGYLGSYQKIVGPGGWAGNVEPVPWNAT